MKVNKSKVKEILEEIKPAKLIAATKYVDVEQVNELEKCGCMYFGENRVQAFIDKYEKYQGKGHWHFIGTLQTNKVKYIIDKVELIHSVNSYKLIDELERQAKNKNVVVHILLQVNISKEESKHGFYKEDMDDVMEYVESCTSLIVDGFMMMAPDIEVEETRVYFKQMALLREELQMKHTKFCLKELSMGMSQDYQIALQEGATLVRIGRALFI
ncbi:MAG: YggS family pyridoxal phosphate-dependent enzyme [Coprobacillus sp.]